MTAANLAILAVERPRLHAATQAILDRYAALGAPASPARGRWLDRIVIRPLLAAGILAVSDRFYLPGRAHSELAARVNLASPGTGDLTPVNSPTFTADVGYDTDGVSSYLNPGFSVTTSFTGLKYQQDDAHLWARASGLGAVNAPLIGQTGGATTVDIRRGSGGVFGVYLNSASTTFGVVAASGFFAASRSVSTHVRGFFDGALLSEEAAASTPPAATRTIAFMRGSGSVYTAGRFEGGGMGAGLSDDQITAMQAVFAAAWVGAPPA